MLFATMNDVLLWLIVLGYAANALAGKMFGLDWPKQCGDFLRQRVNAWCRSGVEPEGGQNAEGGGT